MASRYELEVMVDSAADIKNVNWRGGDLKSYAVLWVDPSNKVTTKVDPDGGSTPFWNQKITIPLSGDRRSIDDAVLHIDVVHAGAGAGVKPLVGSAKLPIRDVLGESGIGGKCPRTLTLKRPSGRPQGRIDVVFVVKEPPQQRYGGGAYDPYAAPPYGSASRDYPAPGGGYGQPYAAAPPTGYPYGGGGGYGAPPPPQYGGGYGGAPPPPQSGGSYGAPPPPQYGGGYGGAAQPQSGGGYSGGGGGYGAAPPPPVQSGGYGGGAAAASGYGGYPPAQGYAAAPAAAQPKKSKFGMGTGLAVGAVAGVLGGLALAEGVDYVEDKIADDAAEKVEDDLRDDGYGGGGGDYYDDDY